MSEPVTYKNITDRRSKARRSIEACFPIQVKLIGDFQNIDCVTDNLTDSEIVLSCVIPEKLAFNEQSLLEVSLQLSKDQTPLNFFGRFIRYDTDRRFVIRVCDSELYAIQTLGRLVAEHLSMQRYAG